MTPQPMWQAMGALLDLLNDNGPMSARAIERSLCPGHPRSEVRRAVDHAIHIGQVVIEPGPRRSVMHSIPERVPPWPADQRARELADAYKGPVTETLRTKPLRTHPDQCAGHCANCAAPIYRLKALKSGKCERCRFQHLVDTTNREA